MKKKNIILIVIVILLLLFSLVYFFNLESNNVRHEVNNSFYNNTTNIKINNAADENKSENIAIGEDTDNYNSQNYGDDNHYSDDALMAKKIVEKYVLDKNEFAGYSVYKEHGCWLVPIYDKNTGKFIGSVFAHPKGEGYILGPDTHSEYKKMIKSKTIHKSDSDKHVKKDKSNSNKKAKSNSKVSNKNNDTNVSNQRIDIEG